MSNAKECDICHEFYREYQDRRFNTISIYNIQNFGGITVNKEIIIELCPNCQNAFDAILQNGLPHWLPEEEYDPSIYDWVLVKTKDPMSGEIDQIPRMAKKRGDIWYTRDDKILIEAVVSFLDIHKIETIL